MFKFVILLSVLLGSFSLRAQTEQYGEILAVEHIGKSSKAKAVELWGNTLFTLSENRLVTYDVSIPDKPRFLGKSEVIHNARQLKIHGNLAYIAARETGLWVLDVRDPANPEVLSRYDTVEMATGVEIAGTLAFVSNRIYGVEILDIGNPRQIRHLALLRTPESQSVRYHNGLLYSGEWYAGQIVIADVSTPTQPRKIGSIKLDGYGDGLDLLGSLCFAATGHHAKSGPKQLREGRGHGLEIHDISNPNSPQLLSITKFPPLFNRYNDFWTVRAIPGLAVVADTHNGVFILSINDPRKPRFLYRILLPEVGSSQRPDAVSGIALGDGVIYICGVQTGLHVARVQGVSPQSSSRSNTVCVSKQLKYIPSVPAGFEGYHPENGQVREVALHGDTAYVACGQAGLHAVKLSDAGMSMIQRWQIPCVYDVKIRDGLLFCAEGAGGLGIYKIEGPSALRRISHMNIPVQKIWLPDEGHFIATSDRGTQLNFIDIGDLENPQLALTHRQKSLLYGDLLSNGSCGGYMLANWHSGGFAWYKIDGEKVEVGNRQVERLGAHTDGVAVFQGKMLYFWKNQYTLLSPNAPGPINDWVFRPIRQGSFRGVLSVSGNLICAAQRQNGVVQVWDFSTPENPRLLPGRSYRLTGNPGRVAFFKGRLLIPAGYQGLLLEKER